MDDLAQTIPEEEEHPEQQTAVPELNLETNTQDNSGEEDNKDNYSKDLDEIIDSPIIEKTVLSKESPIYREMIVTEGD